MTTYKTIINNTSDVSFIEVYTELIINSKLAEEKYFLDDRQISMLIIKKID